MHMKDFGDWVLGDDLKDLELEFVNRDKTAFDLTGATITVVGERDTDTTPPIAVVGGILGLATAGIGAFSDITTGVVLGTADRQEFTCRGKIEIAGETTWTEPFVIGIVKFP